MTTGTFIGVPEIYALDMAAKSVCDAFPESLGLYLVGSANERADWRDIDLRLMLTDEDFAVLFPSADLRNGMYAHNPRWILMVTAISERLCKATGLPVDFQFQPMTDANG